MFIITYLLYLTIGAHTFIILGSFNISAISMDIFVYILYFVSKKELNVIYIYIYNIANCFCVEYSDKKIRVTIFCINFVSFLYLEIKQ